MRTLITVAVVLTAAGAAAGAPRLAGKLGLVQAYCGTVTAAPCAPAFAFKSGTVLLFGENEPGPTCPRTGQPTEVKGGSITLIGVTKNGAPFSGQLPAETTLKTSFGNSPSCSLSGVAPFVTVSLMATVACRSGKCKGTLIPVACLPKNCASVAITSEFVSLVVHDDSGDPNVALATPGLLIAPTKK
jgi:hypothetical protein